jgi:hypothetical protein
MKAKIIFNAVELQHLHKALERPLVALEAHPDPTLTFSFDVEIETETNPSSPSSPHEESEAQAQRHFQASLCPKCAYPGTSIGHLGLLACEAETCSVVLFKGAA